MKILIDTTSLTLGGGQKVGWNFVNNILQYPRPKYDFSFFCAEKSAIHQLLLQHHAKNIFAVPSSTQKRILWQIFKAPKILKQIVPDVIYHIFGACIYPQAYCQVCGEAQSNLFFPEVDFWCELPKWQQILKHWKDRYRIFMLKRASGVIFENQAMLTRCAKLYPDLYQRSCFIKASIQKQDNEPISKVLPDVLNRSLQSHSEAFSVVTPVGSHTQTTGNDLFKDHFQITPSKTFEIDSNDFAAQASQKNASHSVLMLCSWQPNKNYAIMPAVLRLLKDRKCPVKLMFSVDRKDKTPEALKFHKLLKQFSVEDCVDFLGTVPPQKIPEIYAEADAILLLSKLESFSNNIIEAWKYKRPLIISNMEWSRSIVGQAACFVDRDDPQNIADAIEQCMTDKVYRDNIISCGTEMLNSYPDISQHVDMVLDFLKKIHKK